MKDKLLSKVGIIGCGNVGMRYAYALIIRGLAREIVIVDIDRNRAGGEAMDLSHGAPYINPVFVRAGDYSDLKDTDLVVLTAGVKQKPGQTRTDLAGENVNLYRKIVPELMKYSPEAVFLVVANPVDVLSLAVYKFSGKSPAEIIGSGTVLDSARFRFLIGRHCGVDARNIHAYILGEHGDSEFAVWSTAMIGGMLFRDYCPHCRCSGQCNREKELNSIFTEVRDSAYKIIEKKGETSYGIGLALVRITQALFYDENSVLPVSSLVRGYMGIDDVYLSLPAVLNRGGIRETLKIRLNRQEEENFVNSAEAVRKICKQTGLL